MSENNRDKTEIIVKFKNESQKENTKSAVKNKLGLSKLQLKKKLSTGIETLELGANDNINTVISEFKQDSNVEYAQPNFKISLSMTPTDPMFTQQWGLKNGQSAVSGTDINAVKAWDISTGTSNVLVGVLDWKYSINHPKK